MIAAVRSSRSRVIVALIISALVVLGFFAVFNTESASAYPPGWTVQTSPTGATDANQLSVTSQGRYVFVVWRSSGNGSIWFQRSIDYGSTWEDPILIEDGSLNGTSTGVKVMCACNQGGDVPYVWIFYSSKKGTGTDNWAELWIARSEDYGATWPTDTDTDPSVKPHRWHTGSTHWQYQVDADYLQGANQLMFVYTEKRNDVWAEVKYGGYIDTSGAIHPRTDVWLSNLDDGHSECPSITCEGMGDAYVVWQDYAKGGVSNAALYSNYTHNKGSSWHGATEVFYQKNRSFMYPKIDYEKNFPTMICAMKNTDNNQYYLVNAYINTTYDTWRGFDGSDPPDIGGSIVYSNGAVAPHPAIFGPWGAETWLFENKSGGISLHDDNTIPNIPDCQDTFGSMTSKGVLGSVCAEDRNFIGIAAEDGRIYMRRKDTVAPPDVQLTNPATGQAEDIFKNSDFDITSTAADNYSITGPDMTTGYNYYNGIRRVHYEYTEDGSAWNLLECSGADHEEDGNYYAVEPPYRLTAVAAPLAGKRIKIRACAEDSAGNDDVLGNIGYGESPGWILIDMEKPVSRLTSTGSAGFGSFYVAFPSIELTSDDPGTERIEYRLTNTQAGSGDGNWTTFTKPFSLKDGIWKVEHRAIDKAGNVGDLRKDTVKVDTRDPVCSITMPKRDTIQTGYSGDQTFKLGGTATDINDLQWAGIYVDNEKVCESYNHFEMSHDWPLAGIPEGNHTITVKARDSAGNVGSASKKVWIGNAVKDWYFAEGNTLPEFDEYICLMNPGDRDALVQISFLLENGQVITRERSMRPKQRDTIRVKDYVEQGHHVSTKVHCNNQAIIAERPMYFLYKGQWKGGHNCMGINVLQNNWYFAEGTTRKNDTDGYFEEWITLMNPHNEATANVTITYMLEDGSNINAYYSIAPHSRCTVEVEKDIGLNRDVSAKVSSDVSIAAERPMYFNYHGFAVDGSNVVGTSGPSEVWYFAEGATQPGFQEWITLQNPNDVSAECTITYMTGSGRVSEVKQAVAPRSRATVDVLGQVGDNENVSTKVEANVPIIAERPMYFVYGMNTGKFWDGGEAAMGNPDPSTEYFLAEGCTITNFDTWYTLQNPRDDKGCSVTIEYMFGDGSTQTQEYWVEPHSRLTISVNDAVQMRGDVSGAISASFPIVIERPMYFNYHGITGGHNAVGFGVD